MTRGRINIREIVAGASILAFALSCALPDGALFAAFFWTAAITLEATNDQK